MRLLANISRMGEESDDSAPTGVAPTELGQAVGATEAHTAWSLDDGAEWEPPSRLTPAWITAAVVAGSLVLIVVAGVLGLLHLRDAPTPLPPAVPSTSVAAAPVPPSAMTTTPPPLPVPPPPAQTVTVQAPPPPAETRIVTAPPVWNRSHDNQLVATLRAYGWSVWDPVAVTGQARDVCRALQQGATPQSIIGELTSPGSPTTRTEAEIFVRTATETYPNCP